MAFHWYNISGGSHLRALNHQLVPFVAFYTPSVHTYISIVIFFLWHFRKKLRDRSFGLILDILIPIQEEQYARIPETFPKECNSFYSEQQCIEHRSVHSAKGVGLKKKTWMLSVPCISPIPELVTGKMRPKITILILN